MIRSDNLNLTASTKLDNGNGCARLSCRVAHCAKSVLVRAGSIRQKLLITSFRFVSGLIWVWNAVIYVHCALLVIIGLARKLKEGKGYQDVL